MPLLGRIVCLLACCHLVAAEALFERGHWNVPVVMPANPEPDEWYAAHSLVDWCERVTGKKPALVEESANAGGSPAGLYVGKTQAAQKAGVLAPPGEGDTAICRAVGHSVFLIGNNPTATRIAVGRFCERSLGIFFAFPGPQGADWVTLNRVDAPADDQFRPAFAWREIGGLRNELSHEWAYSVGYGRAPSFSHGLYAAFGKKEFAEDPTLFASVNGVRQAPKADGYDANPNLAHPRAAEMGARHARAWFHQHPNNFCVPLGVNDSLTFDDSVPSEGWYRERPVRTDYVVRYLNEVAKSFWQPSGDLRGDRHAIGTLAYLQTLRAPTVKVDPAIFPWVCADRIGYADPNFAAQESANLKAWVQSGARRVGAYDYWYGVDYTCPRTHFTAQTASIRTAHAVGVKGWYAELAPLWGFDAPKAWLGAKLLERPDQDPEGLLTRWFAAAYGPAADPMRSVYRIVESAWTRDAQVGGANQWIRHFREESSATVLSDDEVARISAYVAQAEVALAENAKLTFRLQNQRWRLQQFIDAWTLSVKFRQVHAARMVSAQTSTQALASLQRLIQAEADYQRHQQRFNLAWGAYSLPVHWLEFIPTDPRPEFCTNAFARPELRAELTALSLTDETGLSALKAFWLERAEEAVVTSRPTTTEALFETWQFRRANQRFSVVSAGAGLIQVSRDAGTLTRSQPIAEGCFVQLAVKRIGHEPTQDVRLTMTFKGSGKPLTRTIRCTPTAGDLILPAPKGATEVEFAIVFENGVHLMSVETAVLTPRR
jgi:hypothetical protein